MACERDNFITPSLKAFIFYLMCMTLIWRSSSTFSDLDLISRSPGHKIQRLVSVITSLCLDLEPWCFHLMYMTLICRSSGFCKHEYLWRMSRINLSNLMQWSIGEGDSSSNVFTELAFSPLKPKKMISVFIEIKTVSACHYQLEYHDCIWLSSLLAL